eukprot:TRINITY_DN19269_c0_g1_i1.p1 TRINITY_DN19269_c0_g1~~TRINITY_DN19269_c0_g1_i1.p1  ORF type:complete len:277 (-),score=45.38 TRINITY_DN19269_c0_g1_i1:29-859(-)
MPCMLARTSLVLNAVLPLAWCHTQLRGDRSLGTEASGPLSRYPCGGVPRSVLVGAGWQEAGVVRCPRGQDGDQRTGEAVDPTETDFLLCGLISAKKFVVWTPHEFTRSTSSLGQLYSWARQHTTCDFSLVEHCPDGTFVLLHGEDASDVPALKTKGRCLPFFDVTAQPDASQALGSAALKLFEATAKDSGVDDLSYEEADMAFGAVLGYPKYSTRAYAKDPANFDEAYGRAVSWLLRQIPESSTAYQRLRAVQEGSDEADDPPPSETKLLSQFLRV